VFLRSGQLTVYQGLSLASSAPQEVPSEKGESETKKQKLKEGEAEAQAEVKGEVETEVGSKKTKRSTTLNVKFVKVSSMAFEISHPEDYTDGGGVGGVLAEQRRVQRGFVPFVCGGRRSGEFTSFFFCFPFRFPYPSFSSSVFPILPLSLPSSPPSATVMNQT